MWFVLEAFFEKLEPMGRITESLGTGPTHIGAYPGKEGAMKTAAILVLDASQVHSL